MIDMSQPDLLTLATFAAHVGSRFRILPVGVPPAEMELVEVADLSREDPNRSERVRREPFSLLFRCRGNAALSQQMYQLEHDVIGTVDLFLVPVGPDKDGQGLCYEAVFN